MNLHAKLQRSLRSDPARQRPATGKRRYDRTVLVEVGRRNWRSHCWVRTPPRKIRRQFQGYKHTSLNFLAVTFYELRELGALRTSPLRSSKKFA